MKSFGIRGIIFYPIKGTEIMIVRFEGQATFLENIVRFEKAPLQIPIYQYWQLLSLLCVSLNPTEIAYFKQRSEQTKREFPIYQLLILSTFNKRKP